MSMPNSEASSRLASSKSYSWQQGIAAFLNITERLKHQRPYCSDRIELWHCGPCKLYFYNASSHYHTPKTPLLIVFAPINRPDILDLSASNSFIQNLIEKNFEVYLFDWGEAQKNLSLKDYVDLLNQAIFYLVQHYKQPINLLSICQGGVLSLLMKNMKASVKRLVLVTTPIDFNASNFHMANLVRQLDLNLFEEMPLVPGEWLASFFISLNPFDTLGKKFIRFLQHYKNEAWLQQFIALEKWFFNTPPQASRFLKDFIQLFFHNNALIEEFGLAKLRIPVLNVIAMRDKLVSPDACMGFRAYQHPAYTEYLIPTGHLGLYLNPSIRDATINFLSKWLRA